MSTLLGTFHETFQYYVLMFLKVQNTSIRAKVIGKRLNGRGGYGMEVPVNYRFDGHEKLIKWFIKKIGAIKNKLENKVVIV